jgi:hypothetical protein
VGELIPFRRIKTIVVEVLHQRYGCVEKAPPKSSELRFVRPGARIAERVLPLGGLDELKFVQRVRRHAKMHLFRMWKLFGELKESPTETVYRPVAARMREARSLLRL